MEAIGQLLVAIVTLIFEVTIHAIVFIFHLVMAIFSPRYREELRDDWNTSTWTRFGIVLGVTIYSVALVLALLFWIPAFSRRPPEVVDTGPPASVTIEFSGEEVQRVNNTKKFEELVDVAGCIIMRRLAERKEAEQAGAGQPATRPVDEPEGGDKPQPEAEGRCR